MSNSSTIQTYCQSVILKFEHIRSWTGKKYEKNIVKCSKYVKRNGNRCADKQKASKYLSGVRFTNLRTQLSFGKHFHNSTRREKCDTVNVWNHVQIKLVWILARSDFRHLAFLGHTQKIQISDIWHFWDTHKRFGFQTVSEIRTFKTCTIGF